MFVSELEILFDLAVRSYTECMRMDSTFLSASALSAGAVRKGTSSRRQRVRRSSQGSLSNSAARQAGLANGQNPVHTNLRIYTKVCLMSIVCIVYPATYLCKTHGCASKFLRGFGPELREASGLKAESAEADSALI